jgi:hypothetical protein
MKEKYGDVPNVEMECSACLKAFENKMADACPEWADDCKSS